MILRGVIILSAFLSAFLFPYPFTVLLSFGAALIFPPLGVVIGVLVDVLYFAPGVSAWPHAVLIGLLVSLIALVVRRFVRTRIIGG